MSDAATLLRGFEDRKSEADFRDDFAIGDVGNIRNVMLFGALVFYAFFLWDSIIDPSRADLTHMIRAGVSLCIAAAAFLASWQKTPALVEPLVTMATTLAAITLSVIFFILDGGFEYGAAGLIIVMLYTYALVPVRFPYLLIFSVLSLSSFVGFQFLRPPSAPLVAANLIYLSSAIMLGLISAAWREGVARDKFMLTGELKASQDRVRELLHSILPSEIVERIEAGEQSIADSHPEVCIVFVDLVGFTELSGRLGPRHVVEVLDDLFSAFDVHAEQFQLERIKTIGDSYMAVAGLHGTRERSAAHDAADFAFAAQQAIEEIANRREIPISARVGMHVGSVVAGVIGRKKPAFDCWGETVNLASRLEGAAAPGAIMISEATYWRLKDSYEVHAVENVSLKGIGCKTAYILGTRRVAGS